MTVRNKCDRTQRFLLSVGPDFSIEDTITEFSNPDIVRLMGSEGAVSNDITR